MSESWEPKEKKCFASLPSISGGPRTKLCNLPLSPVPRDERHKVQSLGLSYAVSEEEFIVACGDVQLVGCRDGHVWDNGTYYA